LSLLRQNTKLRNFSENQLFRPKYILKINTHHIAECIIIITM
jgi:hypothetical protein